MSDRGRIEITARSEIRVGRPLSRRTLRAVDTGYLATCTATRCQWQGLFPTAEIALSAVENHYHNETGSRHRDTAQWRYTVAELADAETAYTLDDSNIGSDEPAREWPVPRTTETVADLVARGDRITLPPNRPQKVTAVRESRSLGLPTWSVSFCDTETDLIDDELPTRLKNELIAQDGAIYTSFGEAPLAAPAFEVDGRANHQANIDAFGTREEAHAE